ncbi:hypothetical protein GCM10009093_11990 [Brevundimonas terrae]|uniref:Uncharacterized protein n=1 Tax=Brevundimonas terrae TaxID=363631 RepID=A0ABN0Y8E4_9CAUL|nr:hypothetical protein [Brevundimonas terrae]NIJ28000.1 hypothetical protein [Brevundimonas terrae]
MTNNPQNQNQNQNIKSAKSENEGKQPDVLVTPKSDDRNATTAQKGKDPHEDSATRA